MLKNADNMRSDIQTRCQDLVHTVRTELHDARSEMDIALIGTAGRRDRT